MCIVLRYVVSFHQINPHYASPSIAFHEIHVVKKQWPYFLLVFVLPVTAMLWWWGLFSSATLEIGERGGYRYAYLEAQGAYSKLASQQHEVLFQLKRQGIQTGEQVTLVLTDPRSTPHDQLLARTGYIIADGATPAAPLKVETIPARRVLVAEIKAHPLFAYGKTYSALLDYCRRQHTPLQLPTFEIYDASRLRVEMPLANEKVSGAVS